MPDDRAAPRPPPTAAARRRLLATLGGGAVMVVVAIGGILLLREDPDDPTDYDDAVADQFLSVCTADATDLGFTAPAEFCRCSFDRIRVEIPFERFVEIDAAMREDPGAVPEEIDRIRTDCFVGTAEPTPTTASVVPPSTPAPPAG